MQCRAVSGIEPRNARRMPPGRPMYSLSHHEGNACAWRTAMTLVVHTRITEGNREQRKQPSPYLNKWSPLPLYGWWFESLTSPRQQQVSRFLPSYQCVCVCVLMLLIISETTAWLAFGPDQIRIQLLYETQFQLCQHCPCDSVCLSSRCAGHCSGR